MIVFPRAKINLGLRITAKRDDGYHDIETLFFPIPLCDALEFVVNENQEKGDELVITGIDPGGDRQDNLVLTAAGRLRSEYGFPFLKIHLHKAIPAGAGLGGGSSDAAYIMKGINKRFGFNITCEKLKEIALELGSDCPFFIDVVPSFATGRGENMKHLEKEILKNHYLVLLNPGIHVSTKEAYQNCKPAKPVKASSDIFLNLKPDKWKDRILNDFEEHVFKNHSLIGKIKDDLYSAGAVFSLMSGSGSSVYGIFNSRPSVPEKLRKYIIWQGYL
jgi:4-diphosphocytidyl-2-C-methyl-D-erythritol kinase